MAPAAPCVPAGGVEARVKLTCSHGGRLIPCGPSGQTRYVGGETRALAVPRAATFRSLAARLSSEMAGGAEVRAIRHRLADDEDVLVSVTCDEELAYMIDEYDRLRANRPNAAFRVFVSTASSGGGGVPSVRLHRLLKTLIRRVQSEPVLAASAQLQRCRAYPDPAPMRRVQSTQELAPARASRPQHFFHNGRHQCRCICHRRTQCTAAVMAGVRTALDFQERHCSRSGCHGPAPVVPTAAKAKLGLKEKPMLWRW